VLPATHPLARRRRVPLAGLADAEWAATQPGTGHREMLIRACRRLGGFEPDLRHASDDFLILLELVRTTGACALLPDLVLAHGAPGVAVRTPAEAAIGREVFLITRRARTPAVAAVAAALRAAAAPLSDAGRAAPRRRAGASARRRASAG
jgi:DNA-binding transcriptional LysR family regulator